MYVGFNPKHQDLAEIFTGIMNVSNKTTLIIFFFKQNTFTSLICCNKFDDGDFEILTIWATSIFVHSVLPGT